MGGKRIDMLKQKKIKINNECDKIFELTSDLTFENNLLENYLKLSNILDNIKALEEVVQIPERNNAIDNFVSWLKQNGAQIDNVKISEFPGYDLGLQAETDFEKNSLVLEIPESLFFNICTAAPELKDLQNDMLVEHMPQVALAIALLIEKNKKCSKWKPYLDILPKSYSTVLYMDVSDVMTLKGSPMFEPTIKHCRNIARRYAYFYKLFQKNNDVVANLLRNNFSYNEYRWAVSTVMTRQNIIPRENKMVHSLIPMWDMCNHKEGEITTDFDDSTKSCKYYAMENFKKGDQIFIFYGPRTNAEFFLHSGFVYDNNKNDGFNLHLGISKADPLQKERVELLKKIGLSVTNEFVLKPQQDLMSDHLLVGFLRIFHMNKSELNYWLDSQDLEQVLQKDCANMEEIDNKALQFLKTRIKLLSMNYATIDQDKNSSDSNLNCYKKLILQMKISEKKVLSSLLSGIENRDS